MLTKTSPAYAVTIYIAGDLRDIKMACSHWCLDVGCCVTVTETEFIYTGGREFGAVIGLINYPRFPSERYVLWEKARDLGNFLVHSLAQDSVLIQDDKTSIWVTRRKHDE